MINFLKSSFSKNYKPKKAVFIHIQKTAGTSVVHLAAQNYGNENIISHGDYVNYKTSQLIDIPFVSGHFGFDYAKYLLGERKSFTFLRSPEERILSLYYFYRSQSPETFPMYKIAHNNSLENFLLLGLTDPLVKSRIWNNQTWQLAYGYGAGKAINLDFFSENELLKTAIKNIKKIDYVGLSETFNKDMEKISRMLNWCNTVDIVKENRNKDRSVYEAITSKERKLLSDLTALDNELYNHVKSQQKRKCGVMSWL